METMMETVRKMEENNKATRDQNVMLKSKLEIMEQKMKESVSHRRKNTLRREIPEEEPTRIHKKIMMEATIKIKNTGEYFLLNGVALIGGIIMYNVCYLGIVFY